MFCEDSVNKLLVQQSVPIICGTKDRLYICGIHGMNEMWNTYRVVALVDCLNGIFYRIRPGRLLMRCQSMSSHVQRWTPLPLNWLRKETRRLPSCLLD